MKSIQSKILFVVIAGLLVITTVVSTIAVSMTHAIMHKDADRILEHAAQREAAQINDVLGDVVKSCSIMKHYAITEAGNADNLQDDVFRARYLEKAEVMFSEVALNTSGIDSFFLRIDPAFAHGTSGFYIRVTKDNELKRMTLTDLTKYEKDDSQNVGWYYEAAQANKGVWLDPYSFPGNTNQVISYVEPLYVDRDLIGVIGFDMNFNYLLQRIEKITVYDNGYAVLLAKDRVTPYNHVETDHHTNPHTETKEELKNGMFLELRADYKDIQRDIRPMLGKIVHAFVVVLVCAIGYTILVTRKIVKPLKRLTAVAETLSSGISQPDFSDIPLDSTDEIGTLSRVLSNTYSKFQEHTAYINALAYRDSLTGIKNTTAYTEAIRDLNKDINTGNPRFGVLMADINNLKETNDKFGHDVGDDLIVCTAKILTDTFKASAIFRIGGDEFAVILLNEDYEHYRTRLEQMDAACATTCVPVGESTIPVWVARGIARFDPSIDRTYEDVFAKADHAMYIHKEESKAAAPC